MPLLAVMTNHATVDRLRAIPHEFWVRMGLAVLIVIATIIVLRKLAQVNKALLTIGVGLGLSIVGFNWIYERNEPTWARPAVGWVAGFFPTKGKISSH